MHHGLSDQSVLNGGTEPLDLRLDLISTMHLMPPNDWPPGARNHRYRSFCVEPQREQTRTFSLRRR